MRKLAALLLALALLAPGALAESDFPVYQVRAPGSSATVYLFPSIHAADERAYPLSQISQDAYNASDYLAVECDIFTATYDIGVSLRMMQSMKLPAGQTVTDLIPQELFERVKAYLTEHNLYMDLYENYHPFLLLSAMENAILAECGLDALQGLDMHFLQLAHEEGKAILEIESIEEQTSLMVAQMPAGIWPVLLESYLPPNDAASAASTGLLYEALLQGDANALETMLAAESTEVFAPEEQALYNAYNDLLLTQRDAKMTAAVLNYLAEGKNVFVVVGAAHVLSPTGLVDSLQSAGCAVRRVE